MTENLRAALVELADQMPPTRTDGLWRAGRRMRRRDRLRLATRLALVLAVAAGLTLPALWYRPLDQSAGDEAAVPAQVWTPWMWQASVGQDPPGPATLLFSGDGLGLRGSGTLLDHESKVAVVGRDGAYRMLLYGGGASIAGEQVLISPNGRYVVQGFLPGAADGWLVITDLTTGRSRTVAGPDGGTCCGEPVGWAPDGGAVLATHRSEQPSEFDPVTGDAIVSTRLVLHDLTTGANRVLVDSLPDGPGPRTASLAAFSPDGARIVVSQGSRVSLVDRTGAVGWTRDLGPGRYLAGLGAFSPDGRRIATVALNGCRNDCDSAALAARTWQFGYLDSATGSDADGPAFGPVTALAVRALGWRLGTDLVVLTYQPEAGSWQTTDDDGIEDTRREIGDATLVALRAGGGSEVLIDTPGEVLAMDVPLDLLKAGRFGGPAREPAPFPARPLILLPVVPVVVLLLGFAVVLRRRDSRLDADRSG